MRIAMLIHSKTGITLRLARMIESQLSQAAHEVVLFELKTNVEVNPGQKDFEIIDLPNMDSFDVVIAGAPVWAFSPSPVIMKAITSLGSLRGKAFIPFVTKHFPFAWLGGRSVRKAMSTAAAAKGAECFQGSISCKMVKDFEAELASTVESITNTIGGL